MIDKPKNWSEFYRAAITAGTDDASACHAADIALEEGVSPLKKMHEQRLKQIMEVLATGVPVTLTCGAKRLFTFYPDGTTENHHDF